MLTMYWYVFVSSTQELNNCKARKYEQHVWQLFYMALEQYREWELYNVL